MCIHIGDLKDVLDLNNITVNIYKKWTSSLIRIIKARKDICAKLSLKFLEALCFATGLHRNASMVLQKTVKAILFSYQQISDIFVADIFSLSSSRRTGIYLGLLSNMCS